MLPVPGLCLGDCISFTLLRHYPKSHSVSSDLGCETNFGMNLASELLPCLIPFFRLTLIIIRLKWWKTDTAKCSGSKSCIGFVLHALGRSSALNPCCLLQKPDVVKAVFRSFSFVLSALYPADLIQCLSQGVQHLSPSLTAVLRDRASSSAQVEQFTVVYCLFLSRVSFWLPGALLGFESQTRNKIREWIILRKRRTIVASKYFFFFFFFLFFFNLKKHRQNRSGFILNWKILACVYERCTKIEMRFGSRCSGKAADVIANSQDTLFLRQI